jgi:hypothetical protein
MEFEEQPIKITFRWNSWTKKFLIRDKKVKLRL